MRSKLLVLIGLSLAIPPPVLAHGGGLNAEGCHNDRKNGGYHCHGGGRAAAPATARQIKRSAPTGQGQGLVSGGGTYYANCTAARDAGAAPVRRGDPGYSSRLDRDGVREV